MTPIMLMFSKMTLIPMTLSHEMTLGRMTLSRLVFTEAIKPSISLFIIMQSVVLLNVTA
jgi:hypothetical protein